MDGAPSHLISECNMSKQRDRHDRAAEIGNLLIGNLGNVAAPQVLTGLHFVEQPRAKTQISPFAAEGPGEAFRPPLSDGSPLGAAR